MEDNEAEAPGPPAPAKRIRQPHSIVHEYFEPTVVHNKKKNLDVEGCICNECGGIFKNKSSSTMKAHLKRFHKEIHEEMISKYKFVQSLWDL